MIVAMSGRVEVDSQIREPTINCIFRVRFSCVIVLSGYWVFMSNEISLVRSFIVRTAKSGLEVGVSRKDVILLTGKPLRYGVGGQVTAFPSNIHWATGLSMKASWER